MKRVLLFACTLMHVLAFSQDCQSFHNGCTPPDWCTGGGAQVREYQNPAANCVNDLSLPTPDVGGNNPAPNTLPVRLSSFTAERRNASQIELRWTTATEQSNRGFYVQRKNGAAWDNVAFVFSAADDGNSATPLNYAYRDNNKNKGLGQYRLQQVDLDGKVTYSDVRTVQDETAKVHMQVYPNPSQNGSATITFDAAADREVAVLDAGGRTVRQQHTTAITVVVDNLSDGFYSIRVTNRTTGEVRVEKLMVRKKRIQ